LTFKPFKRLLKVSYRMVCRGPVVGWKLLVWDFYSFGPTFKLGLRKEEFGNGLRLNS